MEKQEEILRYYIQRYPERVSVLTDGEFLQGTIFDDDEPLTEMVLSSDIIVIFVPDEEMMLFLIDELEELIYGELWFAYYSVLEELLIIKRIPEIPREHIKELS